MNKLSRLYARSEYYPVFNFTDEAARYRFYMLVQTVISSIVSGFTGGVFYTGFLMEYGINIVDISILSAIPYTSCLCLLFVPYILERFPKRRRILTFFRILHYVLQILGVSVLPLVIHSQSGRVAGLIILVFVSTMVGAFSSGYSPWHMPYITDAVRMKYFSTITLLSSVFSSAVTIITGVITDRLAAEDQLSMLSVMRYVAFGLAMIDVYLLQKPKEPAYSSSLEKPKLLDVFRLPLSNKRFMLVMAILFAYCYIWNIPFSVESAWLLQTVGTGYMYINVIGGIYILFILFSSKPWRKVVTKVGTFPGFALIFLLYAPTFLAYAFVKHSNYLWLLTLIRLTQHALGMLNYYCYNNAIYLCLPPDDQTNYISFYTIATNTGVLVGSLSGTTVVALMGESRLPILFTQMDSVQFLFFIQGCFALLAALAVWLMRKKFPQESPSET